MFVHCTVQAWWCNVDERVDGCGGSKHTHLKWPNNTRHRRAPLRISARDLVREQQLDDAHQLQPVNK